MRTRTAVLLGGAALAVGAAGFTAWALLLRRASEGSGGLTINQHLGESPATRVKLGILARQHGWPIADQVNHGTDPLSAYVDVRTNRGIVRLVMLHDEPGTFRVATYTPNGGEMIPAADLPVELQEPNVMRDQFHRVVTAHELDV
jgi:hypothetical protein